MCKKYRSIFSLACSKNQIILKRFLQNIRLNNNMYVKRFIEDRVKDLWKRYPAVFVVGPRRAGKTTMVKNIAEETGASYVSLDDPEALRAFNEDIKEFSREYLGNASIIDEIQYGEDAGRKLKYIIDLENKRLLVTGSSARAISAKVLSFLVGRAAWVTLYPFSLEETVSAREEVKTKYTLQRLATEYERFGGFPEVVLSDKPKEALGYLTKTLISKEVPLLENVNPTELWKVAEATALSQGGPTNVSTIARNVGMSMYAARKAMDALEEAFIIKRIRPFFGEKRLKELRKAPKIYFTDPGILNTIREKYITDGAAHETAVLAEILKQGLEPRYWRTTNGAEVDFVLKREEKIVAVEAKLNWPKGRIPRGLRSFIQAYKPEKALIVDLTGERWETELEGTVVRKIPLWELGKEVRRLAEL
jgi:predicted AAA+ superfamily ATPase